MMITQEEIDLRKKEKKIDRKHWMCRIQKYTFNIDATTFYMGYCPFFWMTWVSVLAFPFVGAVKLISLPGVCLSNLFVKPLNTHRIERKAERSKMPLKPSYLEMTQLADYFCDGDEKIKGAESLYWVISGGLLKFRRIFLWLKENPNWRETDLPHAIQYFKDKAEHERQCELNRKVRQKRISKVTNIASLCGSFIFKLLIPIIIVTVFVLLLIGLWQITTYLSVYNFLIAGTILMLSYLIFQIGTWSIDKIADLRGKIITDEEPKVFKLRKQFWFTAFLVKIVSFIQQGITFMHDTVTMTYKQECPLIIWGEETGKIEKRVK